VLVINSNNKTYPNFSAGFSLRARMHKKKTNTDKRKNEGERKVSKEYKGIEIEKTYL
jgi:hypothetical protein